MKSSHVFAICATILFVGFGVVHSINNSTTTASKEPPERTFPTVHNVLLDYQYDITDTSASGKDGMKVSSIEFHPSYVLVTDSAGYTILLAVNRLREFEFYPK